MALPHSSRDRALIVKKKPATPEKDGKTGEKSSKWKYVRQYLAWVRPSWKALLTLFGLALLASLLDLVWPYFLKLMVDKLSSDLTAGEKLRWLWACGIGVVLVLPFKQGLELFRSYKTAVTNAKLMFRIRRRLFATLVRLPLGKLGEFKTGGVVSRLGTDVDQLSGFVQQAMIAPSVAILRIILTVTVLVFLAWKLALATLVALPPVGLLTFLWIRKVRPLYRSMLDDRSGVDARVAETFGGIRVVRAFRREKRESRDYAVGTHTVIRKVLKANAMEFMLENGWGLLIPLASLVIVGYGGYLYVKGVGSLGDVFAFQVYAALLLAPVIQIISSVSATQRSMAAMERVFDTPSEPEDKPDRAGARSAPREVAEIQFDHVSFSYREGTDVLKDLCLTVRGGTTVALVGPSGAGKTTFTDIICRFHDPTTGRVTLNGLDLRDLKLESYRGLLAMVQQETFLFDGSVHENISYGRRDATREQVIEAARRANAHEFISALPEGYDTHVGERGFKLSGGQRQRLSIARAILADPRILILDEATSNLDTESEQLIQAAMAELLKGRTTFVIAHRLSTVTTADQIVVLEAGKIVEVGGHEELLGRRGMYFEMVERQRLTQAVGE